MNIWQSYKQERGCLVHSAHLANTLLKDEESARDNHVFPVKKNLNRLRFDRIMVMGLWPRFLAHPVEDDATNTTQHVRYILRTTTQ